jgi:hypothetical protein
VTETIFEPGIACTDKESVRRAQITARSSPNLWPAKVRWLTWGKLEFHVDYDYRIQKRPESLPARMIDFPWPKFHREIEYTRVQAEIYVSSRISRPIIRLVRKGIRYAGTACYDLAEWFFRLADEPVGLVVADGGPDGREEHVEDPKNDPRFAETCFARIVKPRDVLEMAASAKKVEVLIPGGLVDVKLFRWERVFVKVGSKIPQGGVSTI